MEEGGKKPQQKEGCCCSCEVESKYLPCPKCQASVWTKASTVSYLDDILWCFISCICCCCPMAFLPFCLNEFHSFQHKCPTCGEILETTERAFSKSKKCLLATLLVATIIIMILITVLSIVIKNWGRIFNWIIFRQMIQILFEYQIICYTLFITHSLTNLDPFSSQSLYQVPWSSLAIEHKLAKIAAWIPVTNWNWSFN